MAYGIDSNDDALLALSNFYEELVEYAIAANPQISDVDSPMGAGVAFFQLVTDMRDSYGDEAVAIALERTRSSMNIAWRILHYDARPGSEAEQIQEQGEAQFEYWMEQFLMALLEEPEPEEPEYESEPEEPEYEPEDAETVKPGKAPEWAQPKHAPEDKPKMSKAELEESYRKARRRLQEQIRRRTKAGVDVKVQVPDIPKKITEGSIKRIEKIIAKIKDIHRYLPGRGYRGMKR